MGKFAKWIGGGLGWAFFGPIGGIVGFLIGTAVDNTQVTTTTSKNTTMGGFVVSLLVLVAAVMKADGQVMRSELEYARNYFKRVFGEEEGNEAVRMLRDILKQEIPLQQVCLQIKQNLDYSSRLQLIHFLFGVSAADGRFDLSEVKVIEAISGYLGIPHTEYTSIRAMFVPDTDAAYRILGIDSTATNEEVKKAYRQMAVKYHPDKVSHLGEDVQHEATEKFKKVNEAYETIKKERSMV